MHRLRLRLMIESSAHVAVFAFLPFVLSGVVGERETWAIGSGLLALTAPAHVASVYVRQKHIFGSALIRETLWFDSFTIVLAVLVEVVLVLNAIGIVFETRFSMYLLGVLFPLGTAVAMFVRAIFAAFGTEESHEA